MPIVRSKAAIGRVVIALGTNISGSERLFRRAA
jgi:hypothetical protein